MTTDSASLRAFMVRLIDYAGLFPPAKLPLHEAIHNYAHYRQSPDRWMLSRFIIPAAQLSELTPFTELLHTGEPFAFSVLGRGGRDADEFMAGTQADAQALAAFRRKYGEHVNIDSFEVRLPGSPDNLLAAVPDLLGIDGATIFYETPFDPTWNRNFRAVVEAITAYNTRSGAQAGFKLRCGGVEAAAFPTSEQIAAALIACRDAGVALKATAGLHHPLRRYDSSVQTKMHGFLNVFGAGILAHVHHLDAADLQPILEDENAAHFSFTDETFSWQHLKATVSEVTTIRRQALLSYGSCSFDEPREDLQSLGWLTHSAHITES